MGGPVVVDWDDTLLATTHTMLNANADLSKLGEQVSQTLAAAKAASKHVYVVTNAQRGWVELSAQRYFPNVLEALRDVTVISARSTYELDHPDDPLEWKRRAVASILERHPDADTIVAFGDTMNDREAVRLACVMRDMTVKTVKLVERPTADVLRAQLLLIGSCVKQLCDYDGSLDLALKVSA